MSRKTSTHEYPPNGMIYKKEHGVWLFWSDRSDQWIKSTLFEDQIQLLKPLSKGGACPNYNKGQ